MNGSEAAGGPPLPPANQPNGSNLGYTSFYDGFAGPPGLSHLAYLKFESASSFRDSSSHENTALDNPQLNVVTLLNLLGYYSAQTIGGGGHLGWNLIVPVVFLDGDFADAGPQLKDNASGLGDLATGAQIQFDPIV